MADQKSAFKKVDASLDISTREEGILDIWRRDRIFERSIEDRRGCQAFTFYEGPPTANGRPGIHHVLARTLKDTVCRYKTMRGFRVGRKAGWDTHGLPVELEVEKILGLKSKADIEKLGIAEFNRACRENIFTYKKEWEELSQRAGIWLDYEDPYITCSNDYIESVWWILERFFDEGLIYRGHKVLPYCPRCGTGLSSHEVAQGYKEITDPSVYVRVRLEGSDETLVIWTTTPWTLISNVGAVVHPDLEYAVVEQGGEKLVLAEARRTAVLGEEGKVVATYRGRELVGRRYRPIFDFLSVPPGKKSHVVVADPFVSAEDGSGIVHMAPAFGADDYRIGQEQDLAVLNPVLEDGRFSEVVTPWAGKFVKDADEGIIQELQRRGVLLKRERYRHSYPHCWRCQSPLIYYARPSWYIRTTHYKDRMVAHNRSIRWLPPEIGTGRFGEWSENNVDWALSRDRYWGTPLNLWICDACETIEPIGSIQELARRVPSLPPDLDLHRPVIDEVTFPCKKGDGTMRRTPEVIDCWFDSGSMPYAQWHYPFENREVFEDSFPADFICEGLDQTRGWFYSLHAIAAFLFDQPAYENIMVNGLVLDKNGKKMSKSIGNVVDPWSVIRENGADATRWYLVTSSQPWLAKRFDPEGVAEVRRRFFSTLLNCLAFFTQYAEIDGFDPRTAPDAARRLPGRPEIDRWILSRLQTVVRQVGEAYEGYDLTRAGRLVQDFLIDEVSNWYVRRNRRRFWQAGEQVDKAQAYLTLHQVLVAVSKLMAPLAPFLADEVYRSLVSPVDPEAPPSVHLCDFEVPDADAVDEALERRMNAVLTVVSLGRAARNVANLKVRQPLRRMLVGAPGATAAEALLRPDLKAQILEELNVKSLEISETASELRSLSAKPNFKALGPRFGKAVNRIADAVRAASLDALEGFKATGTLTVLVDGESIDLGEEEVSIEVEQREGYAVAGERGFLVALETSLDEELILEGVARELINRIQNLRKSSGFEVTDRIALSVEGDEAISAALARHGELIARETLAVSIHGNIPAGLSPTDNDINGHGARIAATVAK